VGRHGFEEEKRSKPQIMLKKKSWSSILLSLPPSLLSACPCSPDVASFHWSVFSAAHTTEMIPSKRLQRGHHTKMTSFRLR